MKKLIFTIASFVALGMLWWAPQQKPLSAKKELDPGKKDENEFKSPLKLTTIDRKIYDESLATAQNTPSVKRSPDLPKNKTSQSYSYWGGILKEALSKSSISSRELINKLKQDQVEPYVKNDTNPYTGTLLIVRTKRKVPGSRYFHAQLFKTSDGEETLQHMSIEFKPGKNALQEIEDFMTGELHLASPPEVKTENYRLWKLDNGYVLWMKVLDKEDIKDTHFNAYTTKDIGTVRLALELDIH